MESIGTLAGGIAHDFNNLMTAVTGYSTMLLEDLDADSPMREDLEEIKTAAERAATLTRQLLAFSRKQMLQPRVLNLNRVVDDITGLIGRLIGDHIIITKDLDRTAWPIEVDPSQIEQVLLNLAVNARDAMPSGGTLRITTGNVQLKDPSCLSLGLAEGDYVLLTVSDDGCGMDAETKAHIFEPFFSTKPVGKGTGLGLSTVHGVIKLSGGEIEVLSTPGDGTQFKIFLPRVRSDDEEQ
jgi:signal transduction histidine kinase